jgi:hypothetical protein
MGGETNPILSDLNENYKKITETVICSLWEFIYAIFLPLISRPFLENF